MEETETTEAATEAPTSHHVALEDDDEKEFDPRPYSPAKIRERRRAQEAAAAAAKAAAPPAVTQNLKDIVGAPVASTINQGGGPGIERDVVVPDDELSDDEEAPPVIVRSKPKVDISGTLEDALNKTPLVVGVYIDGTCPNGTALLRYLTLLGRTGEQVNPDDAGQILVHLNRNLVAGLIALLRAKTPEDMVPVTTGRQIGADEYRPCFKPTEFSFTEIPTGSMTIRPMPRGGDMVGVLDMRKKDNLPQ